jgi:UDP-glucose 6-dehydrogenase
MTTRQMIKTTVKPNEIRYTVKFYDAEADVNRVDTFGVNGHAYTPNMEDAREWAATSEQFTFVTDLLGLDLSDDGETYVSGKVNRVEKAFDKLLKK